MKRAVAYTFLLILVAMTAMGCGKAATGEQEQQQPAPAQASEMRKVTDAKGEVEIPAQPKRIADISGASEELLILGHTPVATANTDSYDHEKPSLYVRDQLKDSKIVGFYMMDTINIEAVMSSEPDLIIMNSRQEKIYEQLQKIAPVVVLKNSVEQWRDRFTEVGAILGQEQDVEKWLANYDAKAQKIGEQIKAKSGNETFSIFLAHKKGPYLLGNEGAGSVLYDDLKLPKPATSPDTAEKTMVLLTLEGITTINPDRIILLHQEGGDEAYKDSAVWKGLKAYKNNQIYYLPANPYYNQAYMPIGKELLLDTLEQTLNK